jgi:C1A family cysteine protease
VCGGATYRLPQDGIKSLADKGLAPEALWPYNIARFAQAPSKRVYERAVQFQALEYRRVDATATSIKTAIAEGYPVVGGFNVFSQIDSAAAAQSGIIELPGPNEDPIGGHCIYLCAFDQRSGYITGRNSWGDRWGDKGDIHLPEQYLEEQGADFWIITKAAWGPYKKP